MAVEVKRNITTTKPTNTWLERYKDTPTRTIVGKIIWDWLQAERVRCNQTLMHGRRLLPNPNWRYLALVAESRENSIYAFSVEKEYEAALSAFDQYGNDYFRTYKPSTPENRAKFWKGLRSCLPSKDLPTDVYYGSDWRWDSFCGNDEKYTLGTLGTKTELYMVQGNRIWGKPVLFITMPDTFELPGQGDDEEAALKTATEALSSIPSLYAKFVCEGKDSLVLRIQNLENFSQTDINWLCNSLGVDVPPDTNAGMRLFAHAVFQKIYERALSMARPPSPPSPPRRISKKRKASKASKSSKETAKAVEAAMKAFIAKRDQASQS